MSEICAELHAICRILPIHRFPYDPLSLPRNGIYIVFENDEQGHGGNRIVRVGTHTGPNQLPSRLGQHFLIENKDRSIFRKNIGRALLQKNKDSFLTQWEIDRTSRTTRGILDNDSALKQQAIEKLVTGHIRDTLSFMVLPMEERADRLFYESKIISTVSLCTDCHPSPTWLGLYSPKDKIRISGLWLVNELNKLPLTLADLAYLRELVQNLEQSGKG